MRLNQVRIKFGMGGRAKKEEKLAIISNLALISGWLFENFSSIVIVLVAYLLYGLVLY